METVFSTERCVVCEAPLRPSEVTKHTVACITLTMSSMPNLVNPPPPVPEDLQHYCRYIHLKDQEETHLRVSLDTDTHLPGHGGPATPAMDKYRAWMREQREGYHGHTPGQTFPLPPGKTPCYLCNGLTHMYPDCIGCDGKGYRD